MLLDGYVRVSQVAGRGGERFISPSVQRQEIEQWAASHRVALGEIFEELNESGGRADRPLLMRALERVEHGESDGLVVAKLDRFGRSLIDGLKAIMRIEEAGGVFISVQDGIDQTTPTGKLVLRILLSVGEWELDRVRNGWENAREQAIARGVYVGATAPLGYERGEDGRLRIDPVAGPVMRELFQRRAGGDTCKELARFLNEGPIESMSGVPFSAKGVYAMVRNTAYKGEARSGPQRNPAAHEAIVDAATWQRCQFPSRRPHTRVEGLVGGIIRCAACGRAMTPMRAMPGGESRTHIYRCYAHEVRCERPATVRTEELDPLIEELIFGGRHASRANGRTRMLEECEAAVAAAEEDLVRYRDNPRLLRTLGSESFEAGIASRQLRLEQKLLYLARARRAVERPRVDVEALEGEWPRLSWDGRRRAARELIDCVVVERGGAPAIERCAVFKRGQGPVMVRRGERMVPIRLRLKDGLPLKEPRPWPKRRIEAELRLFFAEREAVWPNYLGFAEAGRGRLHAQAMAWGGPYHWGRELGIEIPDRTVIWSESAVRGGLAPLLEGRTRWPERSEFEAAGLAALFRAVQNHGGRAHWAEEFGIECPSRVTKWSKERVERELIDFLGGRRILPTKTEFTAEGRRDLYAALRSYGGKTYWMRRLGLEVQVGPLDREGGR